MSFTLYLLAKTVLYTGANTVAAASFQCD